MIKTKCAIVGGSGYIGGELTRLLLMHPIVEVVSITANEMAGSPIGKTHPNLSHLNLTFNALYDIKDATVLFLALPHGSAMQVVDKYPNHVIIDTSADFRLRDKSEFEKFYKSQHCAFEKTGLFTYGLPELFRDKIKVAKNIAAPGCFATAVLLSIFPIVSLDLYTDIIINAVTGSSGSGIKAQNNTHYPFRADSFYAYELFTHRHIPEIRQALRDKTKQDVDFIFQPHSGPFIRGIHVTAIVKLPFEITKEKLLEIYKQHYGSEHFIRFVDGQPNIKWVQGTNFCDLSVAVSGQTAIITLVIDNLLKGGAAQAVQCFNIMNGFAETDGLQCIPSNP